MTSIAGISAGSIGFDQLATIFKQSTEAVNGVDAGAAARGDSFGALISNGIGSVESLNQNAQTQAVRAATGDLTDIQDYVIAANKAQIATELTTTLRNKALDSFNEIMRMPL